MQKETHNGLVGFQEVGLLDIISSLGGRRLKKTAEVQLKKEYSR